MGALMCLGLARLSQSTELYSHRVLNDREVVFLDRTFTGPVWKNKDMLSGWL